MFIIPIPVPIKAKWFVIGYAVIELMSALGNPGDGIAHMAHLGGMLFGLALILYWRKHPGDRGGRFFGGSGNGYGGYGGYDNYFTRYEDVTNERPQKPSLWERFKQWLEERRSPKTQAHSRSGHRVEPPKESA